MDLNDATHTCRCGGFIRDEANMADEWKIKFVPFDNPDNLKRERQSQHGDFVYINPKGEDAHYVRFSDAMKASSQWRTVP